MHKVVNVTIHMISFLCLIVLFNILSDLGSDVKRLAEENKKLVETMGVMGDVINTNTSNIVDVADVLNTLPENEEFIRVMVKRVIKNIPDIVVETEGDLEGAIAAANEAIAEISEAGSRQ
jgi:hypothetical protein